MHRLAEVAARIKYTWQAVWIIAIGAIVVAAALALSALTTAGVGIHCHDVLAAGGVGILNSLRDYNMEKISDTHVKLTKS